MRPPRLGALRGLVLAVTLAAPLALPGQAAAGAPEPGGDHRSCKVVLLAVRARGVPAGLAALADTTLTEELVSKGCTVLDDKSVAAMWKLLGLRPDASTPDLQRLGRSLLSDWVLVPALSMEGQLLRVEVWALKVARLEVIRRWEQIPGEEVLPALARLAGQALGYSGEAAPVLPAPKREGSVALRPASQEPPPLPGGQGGPGATGTPPPAGPAGPGPGEPSSLPVPSGPRPAASTSLAGPGTEAGVASTGGPFQLDRPRFMAASGLRVFHIFGTGQVGPALEVELGVLRKNYRLGGLYRAYFGEVTSHFVGGRFEGGPRWGRWRLSIGLDFGFVFTPDMGTAVDMMTIGAELAGVTFQVWHAELHLSAFNLDIYLVMADSLGETDLEPWVGFNSGFSAAFFF